MSILFDIIFMEYQKLIDEIAKEFGVKSNTRYKWRKRQGRVPGDWQLPIYLKAKEQGIEIPLDAFEDYS